MLFFLLSDINECNSGNGGCSQTCTNTLGSFQCSCASGYQLSSNGRSCVDIDECTTSQHNCDQLCRNSNGDFICDCNSGYTLDSNRRTCTGQPLLYLLVISQEVTKIINTYYIRPYFSIFIKSHSFSYSQKSYNVTLNEKKAYL